MEKEEIKCSIKCSDGNRVITFKITGERLIEEWRAGMDSGSRYWNLKNLSPILDYYQMDNFVAIYLDVLLLILANGDEVGTDNQDVCGLEDRVGEEAMVCWNVLLHFVFVCNAAFQKAHGGYGSEDQWNPNEYIELQKEKDCSSRGRSSRHGGCESSCPQRT
jgi:hypothetical protein